MGKRRVVRSTGPPDLLRIEEAAWVLQIGRTTAYALARRYLASDGAEGLPAVWVGRQLHVPRLALEERWVGGPITWPIPDDEPSEAAPERSLLTALDGGRSSQPVHDASRSRSRSR